MAKEKFNWKGLFINDETSDEDSKPGKKAPTPSTTFPDSGKSTNKFPEHHPKKIPVADNTLSTIIEMYESGFESLNKPGYDFYEFFKAIKAVGSNDPQVYKMAFTMAQGVDKKVTKSTLLSEADFYIEEIKKVHNQYESQGNAKKAGIQSAQKNKKQSLSSDISKLEKQLMEIQNQISVKKNELQSIDSSLITDVAEIDQKIVANNMAKTKILETIVNVVDGIKNNL